MHNEPSPLSLDEETLAFAQRVFQHARAGRATDLAALFDAGLPLDLRNDKGDTPSGRAYGDGAYLLTTAEMRWYWSHYVPDPARRGDPLAAPLHADLAGLPPLLVAAAEFDPLRDDSEALVRRLREVGAPVESRLMPGMTHACLNLMGFVDAVGPELDRIGAFLRRVTAAP